MFATWLAKDCLLPLAIACVSPPGAPATLTIATSRGETEIVVFTHRRMPSISSAELESVLRVSSVVDAEGWATVLFAGEPFRFLLGAPVLEHRGSLINLASGAYQLGSTLYVPLQWLTDYIPRVFSEGYRYDPLAARFEETGLQPVVPHVTRANPLPAMGRLNRFGLSMTHTVVIDPGHGGADAGNPGKYLSRGVNEKHVTLAIGLELKEALEERGINVIMTRSTDRSVSNARDRRVELSARAAVCIEECTLFISLHIDALPRGPGYTRPSGMHTYIWGGPRTANDRRVANMENAALEYEVDEDYDDIAHILRDLQVNEHQRESSLLAMAVQNAGAAVHPGTDRGVNQSNFHVLREANRPAILIETGYATNRRDAEFLESVGGQRRLARAIADGVVSYLRQYEAKLALNSR